MVDQAASRFVGIGTLARELNAAPSTIRLWEQKGLLPPAERVDGGRRIYRLDDLAAIRRRIEEMRAASRRGDPERAA